MQDQDYTKTTLTKKPATNDIGQALSDLAKGIETEAVLPSQFVLPMVSISKEVSTVKVKLCTGRVIDVPMSVLKKVTDVGSVESGNERFVMVSGEIDVSTDAGRMIAQMAREIARVSHSLQTAQARLLCYHRRDTSKALARTEEIPAAESSGNFRPRDIGLGNTIVKIPFTGVAGWPHIVTYRAGNFKYLTKWSYELDRCFLVQPPIIWAWAGNPDGSLKGPTAIDFVLEAAHGTPIGEKYDATLVLYVTMAQETT